MSKIANNNKPAPERKPERIVVKASDVRLFAQDMVIENVQTDRNRAERTSRLFVLFLRCPLLDKKERRDMIKRLSKPQKRALGAALLLATGNTPSENDHQTLCWILRGIFLDVSGGEILGEDTLNRILA